MTDDPKKIWNLEARFFYRLVKVLYIFIFFTFSLLIFFLGYYIYLPTSYVDNKKSYIICNNHKTYSFFEAEISPLNSPEKESELDDFSDWQARKMCASSEEINNNYQIPIQKNYSFTLGYGQRGSWKQTFTVWLCGIGILYVFLNLIREMLLYLAFGKRFQWGWLEKLRIFSD